MYVWVVDRVGYTHRQADSTNYRNSSVERAMNDRVPEWGVWRGGGGDVGHAPFQPLIHP